MSTYHRSAPGASPEAPGAHPPRRTRWVVGLALLVALAFAGTARAANVADPNAAARVRLLATLQAVLPDMQAIVAPGSDVAEMAALSGSIMSTLEANPPDPCWATVWTGLWSFVYVTHLGFEAGVRGDVATYAGFTVVAQSMMDSFSIPDDTCA